jgi:hypothetical protein
LAESHTQASLLILDNMLFHLTFIYMLLTIYILYTFYAEWNLR